MAEALRVAFDARMLFYRQAGIGQYISRLLTAMAALPDKEIGRELRVNVLQSWKQREPIISGDTRFKRTGLYTPCHNPREQLGLAVELMRLLPRPDVLHSPDFIPPLRRPCPAVITVHDLAFMRFPELLTTESAAYYGQIGKAVQSAEGIIAVSKSTADDLEKLAGADPAKISVVYEAADPIFKPTQSEPDTTDGGYILFVGTLEPRKNLVTLLEAYRLLLDRGRVKVFPRLLIAGEKGWLYDEIGAKVASLKLEQFVTFLGRVEAAKLPALYSGARVFALPSLYEGFGLPVLEAMACGAPVIVSNAGALPEVAGDVGLLVEPTNAPAWADTLERVLLDNQLAAKMREQGPQHAALFSWDKAARETIGIYERIRNA